MSSLTADIIGAKTGTIRSQRELIHQSAPSWVVDRMRKVSRIWANLNPMVGYATIYQRDADVNILGFSGTNEAFADMLYDGIKPEHVLDITADRKPYYRELWYDDYDVAPQRREIQTAVESGISVADVRWAERRHPRTGERLDTPEQSLQRFYAIVDDKMALTPAGQVDKKLWSIVEYVGEKIVLPLANEVGISFAVDKAKSELGKAEAERQASQAKRVKAVIDEDELIKRFREGRYEQGDVVVGDKAQPSGVPEDIREAIFKKIRQENYDKYMAQQRETAEMNRKMDDALSKALKAGRGMRDVPKTETEGKGIIATVYKYLTGKYQGEKGVEQLIHEHGESHITSIRLYRQPVSGVLEKVVNWLVKGDLEKVKEKHDYDSMFHLSAYITLADKKSFTIEKLSSVVITAGKRKYSAEAESLLAFQGKGPQLKTFLRNAIKSVGAKKFYVYSALTTNCQHLITTLLSANGLLTEDIKRWVYQPIGEIAKHHPKMKKWLETITDIHSIITGGEATAEGAEATAEGAEASGEGRADRALWEQVKAEVMAGRKGGKAGEWSARKAQRAVMEYKRRGGRYTTPKDPTNSLAQWTEQKWRTKSGKPSLETGERYLPEKAIEALSEAEYARTTRAKRKALKAGEQFSAQPADVAQKVKPYRTKGRKGKGVVEEGRGTTNIELLEAMKGVAGFKGVVSVDKVPSLSSGDRVIVNYQPSSEGGSHWIAVVVVGKTAYVFDSFGAVPPTALVAHLKANGLTMVANSSEYQTPTSDACGEFAVFFATKVRDKKSLYDVLYTHLKPEPVPENERVVRAFYATLT